jgi:hypothetical protein
MDQDGVTNKLLLRNTVFPKPSIPQTQASMSPSAGEVAQTPESKSSGAFSIFKSFTGAKLSKSPNPQSPASIVQHLNGGNALHPTIYGGPPNYEQLYEQLKAGNDLADRISAAEFLRHAVQDYPLSGVRQDEFEGLWMLADK